MGDEVEEVSAADLDLSKKKPTSDIADKHKILRKALESDLPLSSDIDKCIVPIKEEPLSPKPLENTEGGGAQDLESAKCYIYDLTFRDDRYIADQLEDHHRGQYHCAEPVVKGFRCHICNRSFSKKQTLKRHSILHSGIKPFKCAFCAHSTYRKDHLQAHIRIKHLSGKTKQAKCTVCNVVFSTHQSLTSHMKSHRNLHTCLHCGDEFYSTGALASHIRNRHSSNAVGQMNGTVYTCEPCRFTTSSSSLYDMHLRCEKHRLTCHVTPPMDLHSPSKHHMIDGENPMTDSIPQNDPDMQCQMDRGTEEQDEDQIRAGNSSVNLVVSTPVISSVMSLQNSAYNSMSSPTREASSSPQSTLPTTANSSNHAVSPRDSGNGSVRSSLSSPEDRIDANQSQHSSPSTSPTVSTTNESEKRDNWSNMLPISGREGTTCSSLLRTLVTNNAKAVLMAKSGQTTKPLNISSESQWKRRVRDSSTQDDVWRCSFCHIIFPDNVMYTIHMGCHGLKSPFQCNICAYECIDKYEFASHIARGQHRF
ncbi:uncharacterized protein LOC144453754 [Glandiceps talaboti]